VFGTGTGTPCDFIECQSESGAGYQCVSQLATRFDVPLQSGFGNCVETAVCGFPAFMGSEMVYGRELSRLNGGLEDWSLLAKQHMATRKTTPMADLLKTDPSKLSQPVYAARWALVSLLNEQPTKFGKLLRALKDDDSDLAVIEKVYGWGEKEFGGQLRTYLMKLGKKKAALSDDDRKYVRQQAKLQAQPQTKDGGGQKAVEDWTATTNAPEPPVESVVGAWVASRPSSAGAS
jgi:hypothetical protein